MWWFALVVMLIGSPAQAGKVLPVPAIGMEHRDWRQLAVEQMIVGCMYPWADLGPEGQSRLNDWLGVADVSPRNLSSDLRQLAPRLEELTHQPVRALQTQTVYGVLPTGQLKEQIERGRPLAVFLNEDRLAIIAGYEEYGDYGLVLVVYDPFPYGEGEGNPYFQAGGWKAYGPYSYLVPYGALRDLGWQYTVIIYFLRA